MRCLWFTAALLASARGYGPPQQPAAASGSASLPTGLTEFCGTNCVAQKQPPPPPPPQQQVHVQQVHQQVVETSHANYENNPFLNGAVDLKRPPPPITVTQGSYQQQQVVSAGPAQPPKYSSNPFLSGQVSQGASYSAPKACALNTLCVARAMCASGVLRQEDVLQAKSQTQPCEQQRGEVCCRVPERQQPNLLPQQQQQVQQVVRPVAAQPNRPTQAPYTGPLNTTPHVGCAAALKCVAFEYCTANGVASDTPVSVPRDAERVPLSECQDPDTGNYGFCCRDPNYKDPWPDAVEFCDQGSSCQEMWRCSQERMVLPKTVCNLNGQGGSPGICCLPSRGSGNNNFQQQQQQFPQQGFPSQPQPVVAQNTIDSRPAYTSSVATQQRPNVPVAANKPSYSQASNAVFTQQTIKPVAPQPTYPQQQPSYPQQQPQQPSYPQQQQQQPSYPQQQQQQPQASFQQPQASFQPDAKPSQTQFFQQQSPSSVNQFPIQAIKVPANNPPPPRPPSTTQQPPRYEPPPPPPTFAAPPAPQGGCGVRSAYPGSPQDGESAPGEFPWQALVSTSDGARLCAGAIVSENAVLVSATCISGRDANVLQVEVGSWSPYSDEAERQQVPVMVTVVHPRFDASTQANDLAVLVLGRSVRFGRFVGAVCLPRLEELTAEGLLQSSSGGACLVSSWPKPADASSKLSKVAVRPVDAQSCEQSLRATYLGRYFQLQRNFICAAPLDPQRDMCAVGLGGAFVCPRPDGRFVVLGASSWDVGCSQPQPAVMCALDVEWVQQVLDTPPQDLQRQQQTNQQQFVVAPQVAEQKPGFSQGYGRR